MKDYLAPKYRIPRPLPASPPGTEAWYYISPRSIDLYVKSTSLATVHLTRAQLKRILKTMEDE